MTQYNPMNDVRGPSLYLRLAERNSRTEGLTVGRFIGRFDEATPIITDWLESGELVVREHVEQGIENLGATLLELFDGGHTDKLLLRVAE